MVNLCCVIGHRWYGPCHYRWIATHKGTGGDFMKDMTLWVGWYGMLATLPLFLAGLLMKERMAIVVLQRLRGHRQ